jgi:hypothetical protein
MVSPEASAPIERVLREVTARGITVIRGSDVEKRLTRVGATASYIFTDGEPGILLLAEHPSYLDVVHEEHHSRQHEARAWRAPGSEEVPALEAATYRYILANADEVGLSPREIAECRALLRHYEQARSE